MTIMRILRFGKGIPAVLLIWLIVGVGIFTLDSALREVPEYRQTTGVVTEVERLTYNDGCGCDEISYRTTIVVSDASDGQTWTLHRRISTQWDVEDRLKVYEITNNEELEFDLSEPQSASDILVSRIIMGGFFGAMPAAFAIPFLWPMGSGGGGSYRGGSGGSFDGGSSAAISAACFTSVSSC